MACRGVHLRFQGWDHHNLVLPLVQQLPPHQCLFQCLLQKCQRQHQRLPRVWLKLPYNGLRLRLVTITQAVYNRLVHVLWYDILGRYIGMILQYFGMKMYYDF